MISHHTALIYTMVLVSAADRRMPDSELRKIGEILGTLPVFEGFDRDTLPHVAGACAELLNDDEGLDRTFGEIEAALPPKLR